LGVTVHFEGKLRNEEAFAALVRRVGEIVAAETLLTEKFEKGEVTLLRVRADEEEWDYIGPTKGVILYLHEDCEPVRLEFDRDLYVQEWVKIQFAGAPTHLELIKLLRDIQQFFENLKVADEGEYWETGNEAVLADHIRRCDEAIAELARASPSAQVKVREPNGRLTDLIK
jgi:hypothetical protein